MNSERHWNCNAHFRYRGSIEYRGKTDNFTPVPDWWVSYTVKS